VTDRVALLAKQDSDGAMNLFYKLCNKKIRNRKIS